MTAACSGDGTPKMLTVMPGAATAGRSGPADTAAARCGVRQHHVGARVDAPCRSAPHSAPRRSARRSSQMDAAMAGAKHTASVAPIHQMRAATHALAS